MVNPRIGTHYNVHKNICSKVYWESDYFSQGNAYGYSLLNKKIRAELSKYCELSKDADIAVSVRPADRFTPVPNKYNVLFTMWETNSLPSGFINGLKGADEIIVPCRHNKSLFTRYTYRKVSVCRLGVDPEVFQYRRREFLKGNTFRILWLGAPNPRKGYQIMTELIRVLEKFKHIEIYLKTTVPKVEYPDDLKSYTDMAMVLGKDHYERLQKIMETDKALRPESVGGIIKRLGNNNNVIWDSRDLSEQELLDLYYSAHCFVFPSFGEGWGLTLCEAMATGLPSISPIHTGIGEFFSGDYGYEVKYDVKKFRLDNYDYTTEISVPKTDDVLEKIMFIHNNYKAALLKAERGSKRIRDKFTWEATGKRLFEILSLIREYQLIGKVDKNVINNTTGS